MKNIVELGPGSGVFTKEILKRASPDTRLFCFEVNNEFCSHLRKNISDKRMKIINAGAEDIMANLSRYNLGEVDCIVSGLPFRNFPVQMKEEILEGVKGSLKEDGRFILFQYTNGLVEMLESYFSDVYRTFVPLNMPPAFVYVCGK